MQSSAKLVFGALLILATPSCDVFCGIQRTADIERLPTAEEVTAALNEVPGVTSVERAHMEPVTTLKLFHGLVHDPAYDQFIYRTDDLSGVLMIRERANGSKTLELYCMWINRFPTRAVFEAHRRFMDPVYASLRRHAPDLPPADQLKETLWSPD